LALARAHGGEVSMESSPEKGTTAIVRLPLLATSPSYSVIK
jgi:signal transduction histidine kinase